MCPYLPPPADSATGLGKRRAQGSSQQRAPWFAERLPRFYHSLSRLAAAFQGGRGLSTRARPAIQGWFGTSVGDMKPPGWFWQLLTICLWLRWLDRDRSGGPLVAAAKCHKATSYLISAADVSGQNWIGRVSLTAGNCTPLSSLHAPVRGSTRGMNVVKAARWQALATGMLGKFCTWFLEDGLLIQVPLSSYWEATDWWFILFFKIRIKTNHYKFKRCLMWLSSWEELYGIV